MRLQTLVVSPRMTNIAGARRLVIDRRQAATQLTNLRQQLIQTHSFIPADVYRPLNDLRRGQRLSQQRD